MIWVMFIWLCVLTYYIHLHDRLAFRKDWVQTPGKYPKYTLYYSCSPFIYWRKIFSIKAFWKRDVPDTDVGKQEGNRKGKKSC